MAYYNRRREALMEEIRKGTVNVGFAFDVWSGHARKYYLSVVMHFVDDDWILEKRIIGFRSLDIRHTGDNIASRISIVLCEWQLENHAITFTLNNASTNNWAIEELPVQKCAGLEGDKTKANVLELYIEG